MRTSIIFDMDGVLVDSAAAHQQAWQRLGEEVGTPFTPQLFQQTFGQRNATIIPTWLGQQVPAHQVDAYGARKEELYRALVRQGSVTIYAGVPQMFDELRALDAGVAIASSGPRANIDLLIEVMGASGKIDAVVASEDVTHGKPDPEVFLKAAQQLQIAPRYCAVIEDSVHGIEAAKRGGMWAVAVLTSTGRADLLEAGADELIDTVASLRGADLVARLRRD
jgi:beta-phosphoglucomutase family hydrolase